ncbi:transcriptional regulator [Microbotryomycetes sp. JL221]|nr:transcriptional regulator [Microbotryomycetes sp. JL221]
MNAVSSRSDGRGFEPSNGLQAQPQPNGNSTSQHRLNLLNSMNNPALSRSALPADADKRLLALKQQAVASGSNNNSSSSSSSPQQPWASPTTQQSFGSPATNGLSMSLPNSAFNVALDAQTAALRSPGSSTGAASSLLPPVSSSTTRSLVNALSGAASSPLPPLTAGNGLSATIASGPGSQPSAPGQIPQTPAQQVLFSPADRFGLLGLLHVIKSADPDFSDILFNLCTAHGVSWASSNLYSNLITPWSDSKAAAALNIEPEFHLPSCYNVQPPPAQSKISNFSDETLFFIFYSQPRDVMQELAAHELYKHNWRYHKELRLWLTKEAGTEPTQKTATFERGSYIVFDPTIWERVRKDFVLEFSALESRRM